MCRINICYMFSLRFWWDNLRCVVSCLCFDKNFIVVIYFIDFFRIINLININSCYIEFINIFLLFLFVWKGDVL